MSARDRPPEELWVCDLGTIAYGEALALQEALRERRQAGETPDALLLLEHPPVYTVGRRAATDELPFDEGFYRAHGIELAYSDRGGRVTYHGPGQLVGYPIMKIADVIAYVRSLESAIVRALARVGVAAHARAQDGPDYTGVWVQERKIASIGVHVQRAVSTHGFAINLVNDLEPFRWVIACGLPDVEMTSLQRELGGRPATAAVAEPAPGAAGAEPPPGGGAALEARFREALVQSFCEVFSRAPTVLAREQLRVTLGADARDTNVRRAEAPEGVAV